MAEDLPLVRALAEVIIEKELKIESYRTFLSQHLFELKGFKEKLPIKLVEEINGNITRIVELNEIGFSNLCIGIRNKNNYYGMDNLRVNNAEISNGILFLLLSTLDGSVTLWIGLNFKDERIEYDPYEGIKIVYKGTKESTKCILGFYKYIRDLFSNGCLKIENAKNKDLMGFKTAFIPVNIDPQVTISNFEKIIDYLEEQLKKQEEA